ncbi:MAG: hypothetical protein Q7J44_10045 [Pseudotabrizicola sp.]|uniref:hypothetical protein n=1 Tax=Pseudotabrizicola sp. TaxID=2939647 RepID=UPI0027213889|nr:hypothetical protein [Pseudotabrizicola sp.]MDO9638872.1 hypothetical protein [Pseudotabrizicola sp.]
MSTTDLIRMRSLEIMRSLAANGEGVGICYTRPPGSLAYDEAKVATVAISDPAAREPVILARSSDEPDVPVVAAAFSMIAAMFAEPAYCKGFFCSRHRAGNY